jgi:hypothetical protein
MNSNPPGSGTTTNLLDLDSIRLPQDFGAELGVKKILDRMPVRRPDRQWFIRVHPGKRIETFVLELKDVNETYLVLGEARRVLPEELAAKVLYLAITRQNNPFFWPIRLPDPSGRLDDWNQSAMGAAKRAETKWISVKANRHAGAYDVYEATAEGLPEPEWPEMSLEELLTIAFKNRIIRTPDHAVIQQLLGAK